MTDFVRRILRPEEPDWVIRSLMDVDFYKFTMGYFIWTYFPDMPVTFGFINRHKHIPIAQIVDERELRAQLDHVRTLRFSRTEIAYLRGLDIYGEAMFPNGYLDFLENLQMPPYELGRNGMQYRFRTGDQVPWAIATWWETIFLTIVSELLYRTLMREMARQSGGVTDLRVMYGRATDKLYRKLLRLKENGRVRFLDFGHRRRHSFLWHQSAVEMAQEIMGDRFVGTSDTHLAFKHSLVPGGTVGHEPTMVLTAAALQDEKRDAQYEVLRKWGALYGSPKTKALRIVLPDTYGSEQFFKNMPDDLAYQVAHEWRGCRADSGDPRQEGEAYLNFLKRFGVDRMERLLIPSDGLDVDSILELDRAFAGRINVSYGWGTKFTNDFDACHPRGDDHATVRGMSVNGLTWNELLAGHSLVCKVVSANGRPAVKLSNNVNKATGPKDEIERYLRIFGGEGRVEQKVVV